MKNFLRLFAMTMLTGFAFSATANACITQMVSNRGDVLGTYRASNCRASHNQCANALDRLQRDGRRLGARCITRDRLDPRPRPTPGMITRSCTFNLLERDFYRGEVVVARYTKTLRGRAGTNLQQRACDLAQQSCLNNRHIGQVCRKALRR
jgi:hypothetical protein